MYAIEAIYDGVNFKPQQPISIKGKHRVVITFLEPIDKIEDRKSRYMLDPDPSKSSALGCLNGLIKIPDDFKEPLDEMKEYMY